MLWPVLYSSVRSPDEPFRIGFRGTFVEFGQLKATELLDLRTVDSVMFRVGLPLS